MHSEPTAEQEIAEFAAWRPGCTVWKVRCVQAPDSAGLVRGTIGIGRDIDDMVPGREIVIPVWSQIEQPGQWVDIDMKPLPERVRWALDAQLRQQTDALSLMRADDDGMILLDIPRRCTALELI